MAGEVVERQSGGGKKGLRRPKRRISIRIDMTPMVDIAFLLLIFYMVSTVFSQPQAMEINLPSPEEQETEIEVKASNLLTLWVAEDNAVFWKVGIPTADSLPDMLPSDPTRPDTAYFVDSDALINLLNDRNQENAKLNTLVLIHPEARFSAMVEILDDIDLLERSWNAALAKQLGKATKELTSADGKFSYRYAMGKWETRDGRIIDAARVKAMGG